MFIKTNLVTKSVPFNTHLAQVELEFDFLISEFGYELTKSEFKGRDFWIVFTKDFIAVEIVFEVGGLPFVTLRNNNLPQDEDAYFDTGDSVEEFSLKAQQLKNGRYERREKPDANLVDDYVLYGREEHIAYLKEAARTVRENIVMRRGVLGIRS